MKKRLRIIVTAFSVSFILMVALSFFSMERFDTLTSYSNEVDHSSTVIERLYKIEGGMKDLDRCERGFLLTHDTMYVTMFRNNTDSLYANIASLKYLTIDNEVQQRNIILLKSILAFRISDIKNDIAFADTTRPPTVSNYYYNGRKNMQDCVTRLKKMHLEEIALLDKRFENKKMYQRLTSNTIKYLLLIFCLATICLFIVMIRELRKRIEYQDELQARVIDLKRSHTELEQIAYAASHDLQEPLRKIRVFSNRLTFLKKDQADAETRETMERINAAANRMQALIEDLVNLTSLIKEDDHKESVDLNKILRIAIHEVDEKIKEKGATVNVDFMPVIKGNSGQLTILFKALLDNSLKFTRLGIKPIVSFSNEIVKGSALSEINEKLSGKKFNKVTISDNGIGFDNEFTSKMFRIFQRLHNQYSEFEGKGIGLAICQRIMANHEGYILADGLAGMGATFSLFFPIEEG